jgi:predicted nucleotidyltransferase
MDISRLSQLESRLGAKWQHVSSARELARAKRSLLKEKLEGIDSDDTSIVVFGSLARDEFTEGSDIDWTLLVDGSADPKHLDLARKVGEIVGTIAPKPPGPEGTFGNMAFSHEIIHQIGGEDDTNRNTTLRNLILLESDFVGRPEAYERVFTAVLQRYIIEDVGFCRGSAQYQVPHFFLNDVARYWRTMAVDFAYKQRTRFRKGWAIRNIKLRMSRKLIYVSGLLTCFSFHLGFDEQLRPLRCQGTTGPQECIERLRTLLRYTPLEILAATLLRYEHLQPTARKLLDAYDAFLGLLSDKETREHLDKLPPEEDQSDEVSQSARRLSHDFRDGLMELFFDDRTGLSELTKRYGVF